MKIYKNKQNSFKDIQKKMIGRSIPVMALALVFGLIISYGNSVNEEVNTLPYVLLIGIGAVSFGIYKGLNRQRQLFESYSLTIDENSIQREQLNTPIVTIKKEDLQGIVKSKNGSFVIKGKKQSGLHIRKQSY